MMNLNKMMKQAQQLQKEMEKAQEQIAVMTASFSAGGGAVEVIARGDNTICSIRIKPEIIDPADAEGLEDLVMTAVNGALQAVQKQAEKRLKDATGGMAIPGLM